MTNNNRLNKLRQIIAIDKKLIEIFSSRIPLEESIRTYIPMFRYTTISNDCEKMANKLKIMIPSGSIIETINV